MMSRAEQKWPKSEVHELPAPTVLTPASIDSLDVAMAEILSLGLLGMNIESERGRK